MYLNIIYEEFVVCCLYYFLSLLKKNVLEGVGQHVDFELKEGRKEVACVFVHSFLNQPACPCSWMIMK